MSLRGQLRKLGIDTDGKDVEIFNGSLTLKTDEKLFFRDSSIYIHSNADGYLTIEADTGVIFAAPMSFTGVTSFSGSIALTGDIPATHGLSVTMNAPMLTLGNVHISAVLADITQTSAVAGTGTAEGRLYGIRSIVRQELDITNVFGVHGMVIATPAASSNVNDFVGVYGGISAIGTFANSNSGLSSWAALKGDIWNNCTGSWDSQVYTLMLSYGSSVNYSGETAFVHAYNHGDSYLDYGLHLIQNSTAQAVTAMILIDPATSTTITTGIDIDGAGTITTGIDIGSATTGIALTGVQTTGISITGVKTAATGRGLNISPTVNNPVYGDGYSANQIDFTSTGTMAGHIASSSSWVNHNAGAMVDRYITPHSDGVWENQGDAGVVTGTRVIFGMRMQAQITNTPTILAPFSINVDANTIDAVFEAGGPDGMTHNLGFAAETGDNIGHKTGCIPFYILTDGSIGYINIYSQCAA